MDILLRIIAAGIIYGGIILIFYFLWKIRENRRRLAYLDSKKNTVLEILVPKNNEKGPLAAENLYASIHGIFDPTLLEQERISFEIISKDQAIKFYVFVPEHLKDFIEGQIYAQYPSVEIKVVEDYTSFGLGKSFAGAELILNKSDVYPIKTFDNFEVDPLSGITGVLSKVGLGEQIWIQMIMAPVPDTWQKKGINYISAIRQGLNPLSSIGGSVLKGVVSFVGELAKTATAKPDEESKTQEIKLSGPEEVGLKGIETKVTKLGFVSKIRILAFANDEIASKSKVSGVISAFKQFNLTNLNGFSSSLISSQDSLFENYRQRLLGARSYILNITELASIFHLPSESVVTPSIAWAGSKKGEPPANLPIEGTTDSNDLTLFGQTNFRHFNHRFGIKSKDRRLHFYAIGKTGTGKSTLLENMIIDDISENRGVAVVDPHGDLIDHILNYIPDSRADDVIYFAPADRQFPIGFNVLEKVDPDLKSIVASGVVGIFKKIFGDSWGPRLEYILRNAVFALLDYPNATMLGITQILVDKQFRALVVSHIADPVIKHFWTNEFEKYDQKFRTEAVAPIQNKVGQFLSSQTIRNIIGQPQSTINLREIMDNKKILLIDLSVGKIGEDTAALLGAMMITKIQLAAMERAAVAEEERIDFYLYVDEFQNFATDSFATILSEARKYRLNLTITNQYIAQMPEIVQKAVFGNVGSIVSFRVGAQDASALVKEYEPIFEANDLVNLDNYNVYVKMAIDGVTCPAFSSVTLPPYQAKTGNRDEIIELSRKKYSRARSEVEKNIEESVNESFSEEKTVDEKVRYPRQFDDQYVEIKDPKTDIIYYAKDSLDNVAREASNKGDATVKTQKRVVGDNNKGILTKRIEEYKNLPIIEKNKLEIIPSKNNNNDLISIEDMKKLDESTIIDL